MDAALAALEVYDDDEEDIEAVEAVLGEGDLLDDFVLEASRAAVAPEAAPAADDEGDEDSDWEFDSEEGSDDSDDDQPGDLCAPATCMCEMTGGKLAQR